MLDERGIAMNKKTLLFEYEIFPVYKAKAGNVDDLPKRHDR